MAVRRSCWKLPEEFAEEVVAAGRGSGRGVAGARAGGRRCWSVPQFELAVRVLDEAIAGELRLDIVRTLDSVRVESHVQQRRMFREMPEEERARYLPPLHPKAQEALQLVLRYPAPAAS